jgi:hypothetical protein
LGIANGTTVPAGNWGKEFSQLGVIQEDAPGAANNHCDIRMLLQQVLEDA